jgi:hypothetical protein
MQDERAERPIHHLDDFPIAAQAPLVHLGVVGQVRLGELPERNVGLPTDPVAPLEDTPLLARLDVLCLLVGRLRGVPVPAAIDSEVVVPSDARTVATSRRRTGSSCRLEALAVPFGCSVYVGSLSSSVVSPLLGVD